MSRDQKCFDFFALKFDAFVLSPLRIECCDYILKFLCCAAICLTKLMMPKRVKSLMILVKVGILSMGIESYFLECFLLL